MFFCFFDFIDDLYNEIFKYWKINDMNNDKCCSYEYCKIMEVVI